MSIYILPKLPYKKGDLVKISKSQKSSVILSASVDSIQNIQFIKEASVHLKLVGEDKRSVITLLEHNHGVTEGWTNTRIIPS